jgi:serine/threonine protein kinase/pSer/pThr/pTyr-binding forkhead associated (FHA) protein
MSQPSNSRAAVALVIGIGDYRRADRVAPLRYATRDAKALARLLADPDVCRFPHDRVAILTQNRARRDRIVHYLSKWLPDQAKGAELALIYFAGHGMVQKVGNREEGFLLPYDADPDDVVTRGIAMSDVGHWIDGIAASAVVVCLDCCHAGKVILREPAGERDLELRPAVIQSIAGKGRFLIASCDAGQKSLEAEELGHGLFTHHLLRGLRGAGDRDGDGKVGVAELFNYVSAAVAKDAQEKFGREQRPWTSSIYAGDVYISHCKGTGWEPPVEPKPGDTGSGDTVPEPAKAVELRLIRFLWQVRSRKDLTAIPEVFRCLAHSSEDVRRQAKRTIQAVGWDKIASAIESMARQADPAAMAAVLDGLAAFEAHAEVVHLLDCLVALLHGELRNRTILLLERKQLGLELDKVAALFRDIQSPYRIEKVLGQGLLTAAYLARTEGGSLEVVVRVLRPEFAAQPHVRGQFMDLAQHSLRFVHHNLVLTREARAFPERRLYYAVRDYVEGVTLQKLLESGKRFAPGQIFEILRQLLLALTPLHERGTCHGSIKPSNIFIHEGDRVILGDPALALQGVGMALERLSYDYRYAPPELFRSGSALEPRSDFYALGCVAYELACGQPPFVSDHYLELAALHGRQPIVPPASRGSQLGRSGDDFLLRLLAATPAERFAGLKLAQIYLNAVKQSGKPRPAADESDSEVLAAGEGSTDHASAEPDLTLPGEAAPVAGGLAYVSPEAFDAEVSPADAGVARAEPPKSETAPSSATPAGGTWLLVLQGPNAGQRLPLEGDKIILGRNPYCQVMINHTSVSREHAHILKADGKYFIADLGSRNGTYVNNKPVAGQLELRNGYRIRISDFECVFVDSSASEVSGPEALATPPVLTKVVPKSGSEQAAPLVRNESLIHYQGAESVLSFGGSASSMSTKALDSLVPGAPPAVPERLGRYELREAIGQGGMGTVYKALDPQLDRILVIKILHHDNRDRAARFTQEARVLAKMEHPNILPIFDVGFSEGKQFIVTPWIEGGNLAVNLKQGPMNQWVAAALLEKVARAIQYAHDQGIVHRDLKPANILLNKLGEPLVSDFGLAKFRGETEMDVTTTAVGAAVGTPAYMAPEQWSGEISPTSDIYSLGAILYEMLTGNRLFAGQGLAQVAFSHVSRDPPRPRSIRTDIDEALEAICLKCLAKEPSERYSSAGALADDLACWLQGGKPVAAKAAGWAQRLQARLFGRKS